MKIEYKNRHGLLQIEIIEPYRDIGTIKSINLDKDLFFDIETAEKIALITENRGVQLSVTYDFKRMFLIHHESHSIAAVCRIVLIDFDETLNPKNEIERAVKQKCVYY